MTARKKRSPTRRAVKSAGTSLDRFLADHPPSIRTLTKQLRTIVRTTLPQSEETLQPKRKLLSYHLPHGKTKSHCCSIAPMDDQVRLLFPHGAFLSDRGGERESSRSQQKFYVVRSRSDIRQKLFRTLIAESAIYLLFKQTLL
ncbi:MAG TPA: DUF1801 domain-containing protein [Bacteroidota bacterium]|nr:DUF1801 domain-containing protein [Bacteroidota bacterium]